CGVAVGEGRVHIQLTSLPGLAEGIFRRANFEFRDLTAAGSSRCAGLDPVAEGTILPGVPGEPSSAFVHYLPGRLHQQQAVIGIDGVDAAAGGVAGPGGGGAGVVAVGVVAEERQAEAVLALERAVA